MQPISTAEKQRLCQEAIEGSLILDKQLNQLLDAYDFFIHRYPPSTEAEHFELADLQVSIKALGELPHEIATWVSDLRNERIRLVSAEGFELFTLNEFMLHMHSLALFMFRKRIELDGFDPRLFGRVMQNLKAINRKLT